MKTHLFIVYDANNEREGYTHAGENMSRKQAIQAFNRCGVETAPGNLVEYAEVEFDLGFVQGAIGYDEKLRFTYHAEEKSCTVKAFWYAV